MKEPEQINKDKYSGLNTLWLAWKEKQDKMKPMTQEAYKDAIEALNLMVRIEKNELMLQYASSNNPHEKGDIVTDHIGSIIIEKITYYIGLHEFPSAIYYGPELQKDKSPKKNGSKRNAYQINLIQ